MSEDCKIRTGSGLPDPVQEVTMKPFEYICIKCSEPRHKLNLFCQACQDAMDIERIAAFQAAVGDYWETHDRDDEEIDPVYEADAEAAYEYHREVLSWASDRATMDPYHGRDWYNNV